MNSKLETALTAKQESEAKVLTMEEKIKLYETELSNLKEKVLLLLIHLIFIYENLLNTKNCTQNLKNIWIQR